ncbi:MAG TPA: outer membrane protein transport protein [Candidatus Omnitrophota bacterium]|nr:outer membrane protein transport protein [Candidatus Omnitrophota bacterium]HRY85915.1 outer membrane protein transport protein [Candidatus Omnitrophota bacterium]
MMKKAFSAGIMIALVFISPMAAYAVGGGGLENASFSAKQLALSGAGTATPDEPAAISYNPAGIADLPGIQFQGNSSFISLFTWKDNSVTGDTRSSGTLSMVPTAYFTINPGKIFCDRLTLGVGTDSPFGLMNKYNSNDPAAHYTGWRNYLKMFTIKPTVAYKVTDWLNVGGGPMWYRVYDFGGIQGYPNNLYTSLFGVTSPDGQVRINTSGNHWGWQLGALIKLKEKHRFGYYFRSPVVMDLKGRVKVENSNIPVALGGLGLRNFETGVHTKLPLPMNMTWAYAFQPTKKTHYEIDFTWSRWSTFKRLYFVNDPSGNAADDIILNNIRMANKDWQNAYGIQLGVSHKLTDKLTLRGGSYYYWTPVPKTHFTPSVPDSNRVSFSLGLGYAINKYLTADVMYSNAFYFRRRVNNDIAENAALLNSSVDGTYHSYLQQFAFTLTMKWDDIFPRAYGTKAEDAPAAPSIDIKPAA